MDHLFSYTSTIGILEEERAYEPTADQKCHWSIGRLVLLRQKILTMEHYIDDLKMLQDVRTVARELENQQAFSLLAPMKWFDMKAAEEIEEVLKGDVSFRR